MQILHLLVIFQMTVEILEHFSLKTVVMLANVRQRHPYGPYDVEIVDYHI